MRNVFKSLALLLSAFALTMLNGYASSTTSVTPEQIWQPAAVTEADLADRRLEVKSYSNELTAILKHYQ